MVRTIRSTYGGLRPEGWPAAAAAATASPEGFPYAAATDSFNSNNNHVAAAVLRLADFKVTCSNSGGHPYGLFYGESPLSYPFTLVLLEFSFIVFTIHVVRFLLKPFRQPRIIAEIVVSPRISLSTSLATFLFLLEFNLV